MSDDEAPTTPVPRPREFVIRRRPFKSSYTIWRTHPTPRGHPIPQHYVKIGTRIGKAPELALLEGPYDDAHTLAVCHMPAFSLDYKIGFGCPKAPRDMIWEDMRAKGAGTEYGMDLTLFRAHWSIASEGGDAKESRKRGFVWKRMARGADKDREGKDKEAKDKEAKEKEAKDKEAKDKDGKDMEGKDKEGKVEKDKEGKEGKDKEGKDGKNKEGKVWSARGWTMADAGGELVATFVEDSSKGICGRLTLEEERASDLDVVAMITMLALYERRRRS